MLSEKSVGDACWMIARNPGWPDWIFDLVPQCRREGILCIAPVYQYMEPVLKVEHFQGYDWNYVGGMGQRMAVLYSPQADAGGNHYFALVKVSDFGDPAKNVQQPPEYRDDRNYFVWAVSSDGVNWQYEKINAKPSPNCLNFDDYLTDVSTEARPILYRECFQSDINGGRSNEVFHHYALFYSDPTKHDIYGKWGDGFLYVIFGYIPTGSGIHNLAVRIPFSLSSCIGRDLTRPIEIYRDDDPGDGPYCQISGRWEALTKCLPNTCNPLIVPSDYAGCIPKNVSQSFRSALFNNFVPGVATPSDWITLAVPIF